MSDPAGNGGPPEPTPPSMAGPAGVNDEATWSEVLGVQARVEKHPYGMLAAAFGVGYVIGGGLFTPTTGRILGLGARLVGVPMVRNALLDLAEAAVDGLLQKSAADSGNGSVPPSSGPAA